MTTFTMTQLAAGVRQRTSFAGGTFGKGAGPVPVQINVSVAGNIHARTRAADGSTILQDTFLAANVGTGAQTLNVPGVEARKAGFYVDLSGDAGATWTNGTTLIRMGENFGIVNGQSLAVRMVNTANGDNSTIASTGATIDPDGFVFAQGDDNPGVAVWKLPAEGTHIAEYNSAFAAEFLKLAVAGTGVACGLVGYAVGQTPISYWVSGATGANNRAIVLDAVPGGFRVEGFMQGHSDSIINTNAATYDAALSNVFADIHAHNAFPGAVTKMLATIPNLYNGWGTDKAVEVIRKTGSAWAAAHGAIYVQPADLNEYDGVHPSQVGARRMAQHFWRELRPLYGLAHDDTGPSIASATRANGSADVVLTMSLPAGATSLASVGDPKTRFTVASRGNPYKRGISALAIAGSTITLTLAQVPADNAALDLYFARAHDPAANGAADMIYDNNVDGDGIALGRHIEVNLVPAQAARPGANLGMALNVFGAPTWGASSAGFGQRLTGGGNARSTTALGDELCPWSDTLTVGVRCSHAPRSSGDPLKVMFGQGGRLWVGMNGDGQIIANWNDAQVVSPGRYDDNLAHTPRLVLDGENGGELWVDGVMVASDPTPHAPTNAPGTFEIGSFVGGGFGWDGTLDEFVSFYIPVRGAAPAAPYTGNEAGIYALYHLDGNFNPAVVPPSPVSLTMSSLTSTTSVTALALGYTPPGGAPPPPPPAGTLAPYARAASFVQVQLTAGAGETSWEIEVNRDREFTMDESYFVATNAAGVVAIPDLVPDTPYYFRYRKTNGGNGGWSAVMMAATNGPPAGGVPAYSGFSVIPALLVVPEPITDLLATNVAPGSDVANLLDDDPMSVFHVAGGSSAITFRTTGRPVDTVAMLGTLANENVTWRIRAADTAAGVTGAPTVDTGVVQFRVSPGIARRQFYHAFRRFTQTYGLEYWRIDIAGVAANFVARHLVIGFARSSVNISKGQGHEPIDYGNVSRTQFGAPDRVRGWRGRKVEFPLSWISEAEYETKWRDLDQLVGNTDPVLALPNPKLSRYLNDRIAFGEITSARGELMRGDKYAKSLEIRSLY